MDIRNSCLKPPSVCAAKISARRAVGKVQLVIVLSTACASSFGQDKQKQSGASEAPAGMSIAVGWHQVPGTSLQPHCPSDSDIQGTMGCRAVIEAWNGGVADTKRDRLIFWGGGHTDYYGNEVYALDLRSRTLLRLTKPSPVTNVDKCPEAYVDGNPSSRHTYGGLVYVPSQDAMFSFGGSKASCGSMSTAIWKFDADRNDWTSVEPHRGDALYYAPGVTADFDADRGIVFVSDRQHFFRFDPKTDELRKVRELPEIDYHLTGVIDPTRKLFLMLGYPGQFWAIDIDPKRNYAIYDWSKRVRGCEKLLRAPYPGLAYDSKRNAVVAWIGGDSVILFDATEMKCEEETYPGGPGPAHETGTSGRFRYFSSLDLFALVFDWKVDAYVLRLSPRSSTTEKPSH